MKKKVYLVIGLITVHALTTVSVALTIIGWTIANGESLHPQPKPGALKNLETVSEIVAFPILKLLIQGLDYVGGRFHIPGSCDIPILCTVIVINSASLILLCVGLWIVIERLLKHRWENNAGSSR